MKLSDKILYCRKKALMSQEALAERVGVSRQAVSKWETGEAAPEIGKLLLLAQAFDVTTDWLLSEDDPEPAPDPVQPTPPAAPESTRTWVDAVPGVLGTLLRKYGWLFGVRLAVGGAVMLAVGLFVAILSNSFISGVSASFDDFTSFGNAASFGGFSPFAGSGVMIYDENGNPAGNEIYDALGVARPGGFGNSGGSGIIRTGSHMFNLFSGFIMLLGAVMLIAGVILAVELKKLDHT